MLFCDCSLQSYRPLVARGIDNSTRFPILGRIQECKCYKMFDELRTHWLPELNVIGDLVTQDKFLYEYLLE